MHAHELQSDEFYTEHFAVLREMAVSQFGMPPDEAEELVHELLLACMCQVRRISDPAAWLSGALQCAMERRERHV